MQIVIPLAGVGKRFSDAGVSTPKPLIKVNGKTLIEHAVTTLGIKGKYVFLTRRYENAEFNKELTETLNSLVPGCVEICIDGPQSGAAGACLYAKKYINNDEPLVITNCDQVLDWDSSKFLEFINITNCDGAVATFKSTNPKHSYASIIEGKITKIVEKVVLGDDALIGLHYWKQGKDFVRSAEYLQQHYELMGVKETYISITYNKLIDEGAVILPFEMPLNSYMSLGTPEDVDVFTGKIKEFYIDKPKTIFCDIDGTVLKHLHKFSKQNKVEAEALPGVIEKFNEWDSKGHKIILVTARKESARRITEEQLHSLGLCWDHLLMGVTSGERVIINDKLIETSKNRAVSVNVITNSGFNSINWSNYDL